jgi:hypothetical protein
MLKKCFAKGHFAIYAILADDGSVEVISINF